MGFLAVPGVFADLSIRSKLVVIIVASTMLSLLAGFAMAIHIGLRGLREDLVEATTTVTRAAGQYSAVGLAFDDKVEAERSLGALRVFEIIEYACLFDLDRRPFADYSRSGDDSAPPFEATGVAEIRDGFVHVWNPVVFEGQRYGTIYVRASVEPLAERTRAYLYNMLGLGGLLLALSVVFALLLQRFISRPLLELAAVAARISRDNDYSVRVQKTGSDEIGSLYDGFNAMLGQIEKRQKELERSNRDLDQFAYVASHDLKAPLRAISTLAGWLEEDLGERLAPDEREQLQLMRGRVRRMDNLVEGILQYSRVSRLESQYERVELGALVQEVLEDLGTPPGVLVEAEPGLPALLTRRVRLKQVLANLITNAVKYHDKKGHGAWVKIGCRIAGGERGTPAGGLADLIEIFVADNGPGIAPEHHRKIFQIFQTLQPRDKVESTGLGLALVSKLVEEEGGRVWVESEAGAGATFKVLWPARREPFGSGEISKNLPSEATHSKPDGVKLGL